MNEGVFGWSKKPRDRLVRRRHTLISPITRRILAVNAMALVILVFGILYLGEYRRGLIISELSALETQAEMFAAALGEGAVAATQGRDNQELAIGTARRMVGRLVRKGTRARLFGTTGFLVADSQFMGAPGGRSEVEVLELAPPDSDGGFWEGALRQTTQTLSYWLMDQDRLPVYNQGNNMTIEGLPEVALALTGESGGLVRRMEEGGMMITVAVPVQRYKQVLAGLMLSKNSSDIDEALFDVRMNILMVFAITLSVTVFLSLYLAGTIARPIRILSAAADRVRHGTHRRIEMPDFTRRNDEIGELSGAFREMTQALWDRMDAIEGFAADVSHEIKNPLTSLRSAVETAARVKDADQQRKLMEIIQEDVQRLDRLITDISAASRLDAELSRAEMESIDLAGLLKTLVSVYETPREVEGETSDAPHVMFEEAPTRKPLCVQGLETRLVQVFRNLIGNALTFSPPGGTIRVKVTHKDKCALVMVEDEGPGIPPGKEEKIFSRFYSERPEQEAFGKHSGLGLSISRQIAEALDGSLIAENRVDPQGDVLGARFIVELPLER